MFSSQKALEVKGSRHQSLPDIVADGVEPLFRIPSDLLEKLVG